MAKQKTMLEGRAPFTRDEIVRDVRIAILSMASLIVNLGPRRDCLRVAEDYVGVALDDYTRTMEGHAQLDLIPVEEHQLYTVVMDAFDYAYQLGDPAAYNFSVEERAYEVGGILTAFPVCDFDGEPSPLDRLNPQKLRQVLETFEARWALDRGENLTVPQLALLADMGEAAVRTSLSAEGIKTISGKKGEKNQVPYADALSWLSGRRNFVPTKQPSDTDTSSAQLVGELFEADTLSFDQALRAAISRKGLSEDALAANTGMPAEWLRGLTDTAINPEIDIQRLQDLANTLDAPVPLFVGKAVTALLARQSAQVNG